MGHTSVRVLVPQVIVARQTVGHVVRVEQSDLGRIGEALTTEHLNVGPGDEENRGAAVGRGGDGIDGLVASSCDDGVRGEEG